MTASAATERVAHLVDPRRLETIEILGPTVQYLTSPDAGDGEPCVMRGTIPPGVAVPLHSHADPETFLLVSGEVEGLELSGKDPRWFAVAPGDVVHVPGDAKHAWRNLTPEPAVMIIVTTPKMGRFFRELGVPAGTGGSEPPDDATIQRFLLTSARYGYWNATPEENAAVGLQLG
jgi:quercetin dioxygenase-like cupin family protein